MLLTPFLWLLLALMGCSYPDQGQTLCAHGLGQGQGWGLPATGPSDRQTGQAGWAQLPYLPGPSLCQAVWPSNAPTSWPPPAPSPQAGEGSDV